MKKFFLTILFGWNAQNFAAEPRPFVMSATTLIDLDQNLSEMTIHVSYPGPRISGLCGLELRSNTHDISPFANEIEVLPVLGVLPVVGLARSNRVLRIDLSEATGYYMTSIRLRTRNRHFLKDAIQETLGPGARAAIVGTYCEEL